MQNWKQQQDSKIQVLDPLHANTIKANLQDMYGVFCFRYGYFINPFFVDRTNKIADLVQQVKGYKKMLNLS